MPREIFAEHRLGDTIVRYPVDSLDRIIVLNNDCIVESSAPLQLAARHLNHYTALV